MSSIWRCGSFSLSLDRPLVMGILNVTPDSFSDGGTYDDPVSALEGGLQLAAQGADIVDVGGESTRPGAAELKGADELARVRPVVERLAQDLSVPVSIDTRHAEVARACVQVGVSIVNDVSGFRDPEMVAVAATCDAGVVIMHMLGEPGSMQDEPHYDDVVVQVREYLLDRALTLERAGVARERIAIDPGIGFGKTLEHNIALLRALPELAAFGYPVLVGVSRKRFIGVLTGTERPDDRLGGSLASAVWAVEHGASIARVHDVAQTVQALKVIDALREKA
ncbi:MAG: dihydropteroate synthase [Actinomycetota bacterium]|nr:dihydropteroate synthase [Actinomycetota bacterium]